MRKEKQLLFASVLLSMESFARERKQRERESVVLYTMVNGLERENFYWTKKSKFSRLFTFSNFVQHRIGFEGIKINEWCIYFFCKILVFFCMTIK